MRSIHGLVTQVLSIATGAATDGRGKLAVVIGLGLAIGATACLIERRFGFNLADAGALWYGVQQVLRGAVPIRDFASYDPLRYYWAAEWLRLFHARGITAVRTATWAFATLGVACAGVLVWSVGLPRRRRILPSAIVMVLCVLWMFPWWKQYDATISIVLVASLSRVWSKPTVSRFFVHGVIVGVAALVGQNHGVYGVVASILAAPFLGWGQRIRWSRSIAAWVAGVVIGFSPMLGAIAFSSGFAKRLFQSVRLYQELRSTNIYLPVPWPWTIATAGESPRAIAFHIIAGCVFIALPLFPIIGITCLLRHFRRRCVSQFNPVLGACFITSIPYLNVAFSRADLGHLAQSMMPCVIGIVVVLMKIGDRAKRAWHIAGACMVVAVFVYVTLPSHPVYEAYTTPNWREVMIGNDSVWMRRRTANLVHEFENLSGLYAGGGAPMLAVPFFPGVYALLGRRSPTYEIYPLVKRTERFQEGEIARLRETCPRLVVVDDNGLDGRADLRYSATHQYVWAYIRSSYSAVVLPSINPALEVYVPRECGMSCSDCSAGSSAK